MGVVYVDGDLTVTTGTLYIWSIFASKVVRIIQSYVGVVNRMV